MPVVVCCRDAQLRLYNFPEIMQPVFRANGYKIPPIRAVIIPGQTVGGYKFGNNRNKKQHKQENTYSENSMLFFQINIRSTPHHPFSWRCGAVFQDFSF